MSDEQTEAVAEDEEPSSKKAEDEKDPEVEGYGRRGDTSGGGSGQGYPPVG